MKENGSELTEVDVSQLLPRDAKGRLKLRWEAFARLELRHVRMLYRTEWPLVLNLSGVTLFGHDGLIWLLSVLQYRSSRGCATFFVLPEEDRAVTYLEELRFLQLVEDCQGGIVNPRRRSALADTGASRSSWPKSQYSPTLVDAGASRSPRPKSQYSPTFLQAITPSRCSSLYEALWHYFDDDMAGFLGSSPSAQLIAEDSIELRAAMGELLLNVARHGSSVEAKGHGFMCYRPWPRGYPLIRFCCNDLGPGFAKTLATKVEGPVTGEAEAIMKALYFRFEQPDEGVIGLYGALPFIRRLRGRILIRSRDTLLDINFGLARVQEAFDTGYKSPSLPWARSLARVWNLPHVAGTHIALDLSARGRK